MPASQAGRGGFESRLPLQAFSHLPRLARNLTLDYPNSCVVSNHVGLPQGVHPHVPGAGTPIR
jgi:hypothetical protein